jgi:hypothetical protein
MKRQFDVLAIECPSVERRLMSDTAREHDDPPWTGGKRRMLLLRVFSILALAELVLMLSVPMQAADCPQGATEKIQYNKIEEVPQGVLVDQNGQKVDGHPVIMFNMFFSNSALQAVSAFSRKYALCRTKVISNGIIIGSDTFSPFASLDEIQSQDFATFLLKRNHENELLFSALASHEAEVSLTVNGR